jgi:SOS-response transcriptional repressor LexA
MKNGYAICLNKWTLDDSIKNELRLLLIISSLCAKDGYCYASNEYLSNLFNESEHNISVKLKKLESKGYLNISYERTGSAIKSREIRLIKKSTAVDKNINGAIDKNIKENNFKIIFNK